MGMSPPLRDTGKVTSIYLRRCDGKGLSRRECTLELQDSSTARWSRSYRTAHVVPCSHIEATSESQRPPTLPLSLFAVLRADSCKHSLVWATLGNPIVTNSGGGQHGAQIIPSLQHLPLLPLHRGFGEFGLLCLFVILRPVDSTASLHPVAKGRTNLRRHIPAAPDKHWLHH